MLAIPTIPAATIALTFTTSWNTGDSWEISEMPGGCIQEEQQPECPPLPGLECAAERVVFGRTLSSFRGRRRPTLGLPSLWWVLHEVTGNHDYDQIANAQISKSLEHSDTLDEMSG